jgi:ABC-type sugar transport system permease subunit
MSASSTGMLSGRPLAHRGGIRRAVRRSWPAYLLLLPFLVHFVLVVAYPFLYSIYLSFFQAGLNTTPTFVGLRNFAQLFGDVDFRTALGNTFYYAVFAVIGDTIIPLAMAIILNEQLRGRIVFRMAYFLPVVTSWAVVALIWSILFDQQGVINGLLQAVGVAPQPFLANGTQAKWIIIAAGVWKDMGYYMVIYLAALQSVPRDLVEAAAIDGAGKWRSLWHVTLPSLRPVIYFVITIATIYTMQFFTAPYIMTQGGPLNATLSVVQLLYRTAFVQLNFGYGSAMATVLFVILAALSFLNKKLNDWITR